MTATHETRIRLGSFGRKRFDITHCTGVEADRREAKMREVASDMVAAGLAAEAVPLLTRIGTAPDAEAFRVAVRLAEGLCSGRIPKKKEPSASSLTLRMVAAEWTSGALHRRYPDQIKEKRTADDDVIRFDKHINPVIGDYPVTAITLDHCEDVMRKLPATLKPRTRRGIGQALSRLLSMCVYPLRLIDRSPIPRGFLPKGSAIAKVALFPDEDRQLMACEAVPLVYRALWGFLAREGLLASMARGQLGEPGRAPIREPAVAIAGSYGRSGFRGARRRGRPDGAACRRRRFTARGRACVESSR